MGIIGFVRTLLILLAIYYGYKFLTKYIFPLMFRNYVNKMTNKHRQHNQFQKDEGDVTIRYNNQKNEKKVDKDKGEYVDYEEIN